MPIQFEWNVVEWLSGLIYGQSDLDLQNTSFTFEAQSSSASETDSLPLPNESESLITPALWHYMSSPGCYVENQDIKEISSPNIYIDFGSCAEVEFKLDGAINAKQRSWYESWNVVFCRRKSALKLHITNASSSYFL